MPPPLLKLLQCPFYPSPFKGPKLSLTREEKTAAANTIVGCPWYSKSKKNYKAGSTFKIFSHLLLLFLFCFVFFSVCFVFFLFDFCGVGGGGGG